MEDLEILQPFGPSILKVTIPDEMIKQMNNYIDEVIKDEKKSKFLDGGYKLAGNVAQEISLEGEFMKKIKWIDFLALSVQRWLLKKTGKKLNFFNLGFNNRWQKILSNDIKEKMNLNFKNELKELGYNYE